MDRLSTEYQELLISLKQRIRTSQIRAALAVNRELILLYYPPYHSKYNPIVGFAFPKGKVLGHSGATLEWCQVSGR